MWCPTLPFAVPGMLGGGLGIFPPLKPLPMCVGLVAPDPKFGARCCELTGGTDVFTPGAAFVLKLGGAGGAPARPKGDALTPMEFPTGAAGLGGLALNPEGGAGRDGIPAEILLGGGPRAFDENGAGVLTGPGAMGSY